VREKKSILGTSTMFIFTIIIVVAALEYFYSTRLDQLILTAIIIGSIASVSELLSIRGSDNLSVPLFSGLFLHALLDPANTGMLNTITAGVILAAIVAILSYKIRFLDEGGSASAFIMGSIIFGFGGWAYTFPILGFFIISSMLSKIGKSKKKAIESAYQKSGIRDFQQALANGGVPTIIVLLSYFTQNDIFYMVYLVSLAAATADTWGTELGIFSRTKPVLITSFKRVDAGTSGGITPLGSLAALAGSIFIVTIGSFFSQFGYYQFISMSLLGYLGSFVDSILGATVQGQYKCEICHKLTERLKHCNTGTSLVRGQKWIDNDFVNIFSISFSSLLIYLIFI
jgi:uncharacterized protein (TIGR00297 family)